MTLLFILLAAAACASCWQASMATASEPSTDEPKVLYRDLRGPGPTILAGLIGAVVMAIAMYTTARPVWPVWAVLAVDGSVLALVDAWTTWMPKRLAHVGWGLMLLAAVISVPIEHGHHTMVATLAGGIGSAVLFFGLWLLTRRGFGFGDVRFMPLLGAATGAASLRCWAVGLLLGVVFLGVHAVVDRMLARRVRIFAWGPAFMAGAVLATLVS